MRKQKRPKGWLIDPQQVDAWLYKASGQLRDEDYDGAIKTCKRILRYLPRKDKVRAETLGYIGTSYAMKKAFEDSYQAFDQALQIDPDTAYLWYNFGLACTHTSRTGKALPALERAAALKGDGEMAEQFAENLAMLQKITQSELALRGPDFSLDRLIEQQELFQPGLQLSSKGQWVKSEAIYRDAIALGDCLPQPWGNLGICLLMQKRFDEAEAAYQRALEIDPKYELAQTHLENLPHLRKNPDFEPEFRVNAPFADINTTLTLIDEE